MISRHPRESVLSLIGLAAVMTIFTNALFLQSGPHPAPIFAAKSAPAAIVARPAETPVIRQVGNVPIRSAALEPPPRPVQQASMPVQQPVAVKPVAAKDSGRNDPIADLLGPPPKRVAAIQRALAEFGYGPVKPTGQFGTETEQAIAKFEREHKMPVTGQMSDRVVNALATMTGRSFD